MRVIGGSVDLARILVVLTQRAVDFNHRIYNWDRLVMFFDI
jgi:hypothetical protein